LKLAGQEKDPEVRAAAKQAIDRFFAPVAYSRTDIGEIQNMCACRSSTKELLTRGPAARIQLTTSLAGNGCTFVKIEPLESR
jgi:hypothetical protein